MKLTFDKTAKAVYLQFTQNKISKSIPISDTVVCDLDDNGVIVGIELIDVDEEKILNMKENIQFSSFSSSA
jgi:uncharacterized protein YuzE